MKGTRYIFQLSDPRYCFWLLAMLAVAPAYSQPLSLEASQINQFLKTKTYVVLEPNPLREYNFLVPDLVNQIWSITPAEMVPYKEFNRLRTNPGNSFLILTEVYFENDKLDAKYQFLSLLMGGKYAGLNQMPEICTLPLSYLNQDEETYLYKLPAFLRFFQHFINQMSGKTGTIELDLKLFESNTPLLHDKILFLHPSEVSPELRNIQVLKKYYPYPVKFVEWSEIEEAIQSARQEVVFLHKVGPGTGKSRARCFKILMGAGDGQIYYFDYHMTGNNKEDAMLISDFQKINKTQ
jgi:hypothetical protein